MSVVQRAPGEVSRAESAFISLLICAAAGFRAAPPLMSARRIQRSACKSSAGHYAVATLCRGAVFP